MADRWDALILGAGLAGASTALGLARAGASVLVLDPAPDPHRLSESAVGARGALSPLTPGSVGSPAGLPGPTLVERRWMVLDRRSSFSVEQRLPPSASSWCTLSGSQFGPWVDDHLRSAGVSVRWGARAERLIRSEDGSVLGAHVGGASEFANVTVLAGGYSEPVDGAPSGFEDRAWVTVPLDPTTLARRFSIASGESVAVDAILGGIAPPKMGRGFLLTHTDGVTVGVTFRDASSADARAALGDLRAHPAIAPYLAGAVPGEPRSSGRRARGAPRLGGRGVLVVGWESGLRRANGLTEDELTPAVESGMAAAEAIRSARSPRQVVDEYRRNVSRRGLFRQLAVAYRRADRVTWNPRFHYAYPHLVTEVLHRVMTETGAPKEPVRRAVEAGLKSARVRKADVAWDAFRVGVSS